MWLHSHTSSRHGFDREDLLWLDSHLHCRYALLYILINRGCGKLAGAILAANSALTSPMNGKHPTRTATRNNDFFEAKIDINSRYGSPFVSLLELAVNRCPDLVQTLLQQGANVNVDEHAPLFAAVWREFRDPRDQNLIELLLSHNAHAQAIHEPSGTSVLALAARHCYAGSVMSLLKHGAHVNGSCDRSKVSPLLAALGHEAQDRSIDYPERLHELDFSARQKEVTCTLLDHGADVNLKAGASSLSPVQFAVKRWGRQVVELLLSRHDQAADETVNLLVYAAERLNVDVVDCLLERGVHGRAKTQALGAVLLTDELDPSRWTERRLGLDSQQARYVYGSSNRSQWPLPPPSKKGIRILSLTPPLKPFQPNQPTGCQNLSWQALYCSAECSDDPTPTVGLSTINQ